MKSIYVYSQYVKEERDTLEDIQNQLISHVDIVELQDLSPELRKYIKETPALITISEDMQGENILNLQQVCATIQQRIDEEDQRIGKRNQRTLSDYVQEQQDEAVDSLTLELIEGGTI